MLAIGFFSGSIFERNGYSFYGKTNKDLCIEVELKNDTLNFFRDGYLLRDSVINEISESKECTFEIRSIIGGIY